MGTCDSCIRNKIENDGNPPNNIFQQQPNQNQNIIKKQPINNFQDNDNNKYKYAEKQNENIYKNFWLKNSIEKAHDDDIVNLIELHNKKIMTCSYDKSMKVWNINIKTNTIVCERIILGKNKNMCLLEFEPNKVLFGSQSSKIGLIDVTNPKKELFSFKGHLLSVNCLIKLNKKLFASASNDTDIRIWDYYKRQCKNILREDDSKNIFCLIKFNDDSICSSGVDKIVKIFNWEESKCIDKLYEHKTWIKCLLKLNDNKIISGSDDGVIKLWDNKTKEIKEVKAHEDSVKALCNINDKYVASCSFDKTIKIWDVNKGDCVQILNGHSDKVICVLFHSDGYLITCSNDKTIKIWEQDKNSIKLNANLY